MDFCLDSKLELCIEKEHLTNYLADNDLTDDHVAKLEKHLKFIEKCISYVDERKR